MPPKAAAKNRAKKGAKSKAAATAVPPAEPTEEVAAPPPPAEPKKPRKRKNADGAAAGPAGKKRAAGAKAKAAAKEAKDNSVSKIQRKTVKLELERRFSRIIEVTDPDTGETGTVQTYDSLQEIKVYPGEVYQQFVSDMMDQAKLSRRAIETLVSNIIKARRCNVRKNRIKLRTDLAASEVVV